MTLPEQVQEFMDKWAPRSRKRAAEFKADLRLLANNYANEAIRRGYPPDGSIHEALQRSGGIIPPESKV